MKYKTFSILLLGITLVLFISMGVFNYIIDPYGYNNRFHLRINTEKAIQDERIYKFKLLETYPHADSFLFSSSRGLNLSPSVVTSLSGHTTINCAFSSASADEYYLYIKYLIQTREVKQIIIGIDLFAYADGFVSDGTLPEPLLSYFHLNDNRSLTTYLNYDAFKKSIKTIQHNQHHPKPMEQRYTRYGQVIPGNYRNAMKDQNSLTKYIQVNVIEKPPRWNTRFNTLAQERLNKLSEIKQLCDEKGVNLYLFTSPLYIKQITMKQNKFFLQKRLLHYIVHNIQPVWDYNGITAINTDPYAYEDEFHYNYRTGDSILSEILTGKAMIKNYSGTYITPENITPYLQHVDQKIAEYLKTAH
ncbi:MAG: hypothetical protein Q7T91_01220 [Sulfuricurvum sp.]|nr:hypothetical protein [Sulfuricurvum sp.]